MQFDPFEISQGSPLILGSNSPRRRDILTSLGIPFVVRSASANEDPQLGEPPSAYLDRVVLAKLDAVRRVLEPGGASRKAVILVADTSVLCDAILGKPADAAEAEAMILRLSGRAHEVHTRFALAAADATTNADGEVLHAETVITRVTFRPISPAEARAYAAYGEGMDKAGGYAIQGRASGFAVRIDGSYTCVVGLPACEVLVALMRFGLQR